MPNPGKWHLLLSEKDFTTFININGKQIFDSEKEKILGVYFDNKLNFEYHLEKLCKKASQKLNTLARVSMFMNCQQRNLIMNAFITSQFGYCSLIWMCHNRSVLRQVNKIHERALRLIYMDTNQTFEELLEKSETTSIHHRNLQHLGVEIYKALNNLSSPLMSELFMVKETKYSLRKENLVSNMPRTTKYGLDSISQ